MKPATFAVQLGPYTGARVFPCSRVGLPGGAGGEHVWVQIADGPDAGYRFRMPMQTLTPAARVIASRAVSHSAMKVTP